MEALFIKIFNMSFTAGWLILAVILFRLFFKKAPKAIGCLLWGLVALRLILPISYESTISLIPSSEPISENIMMEQVPTINSGIDVIDASVNQRLAEDYTPQLGASVNPMQIQMFIVSVLWLIGMTGILLYGAISYLLLRHKIRVSMRFKNNIRLCDSISSPFILGIIRPVIYLPSDISDQQMEYVIAHERVHLKRRDHWWKPLGFLLLAVYWFNPLIWIAYWLLCRDIEYACDESVIKELDTEGIKAYSRTLLGCSVSRKSIMLCPLAFGEIGVKQRIKSVLSFKKPAVWIIIAALIACIVLGVFFMTDPVGSDQYDLWVIEGEPEDIASMAYIDNRNIFYYGVSEAKVMIDGAYLDLIDAVRRDNALLSKVLDKAVKYGKVETDTDSGSKLYRLDDYAILEIKTKISVIPTGQDLLLEDINQPYDLGVVIGLPDMQYEEVAKLFRNRQVSNEDLQESFALIDEYEGALLPLKYGGEDINGDTADEVIREYYRNFSVRNDAKMEYLYSDVLLQRNENAIKADIELLAMRHCDIVNITLLKSSDKTLFEQLAKENYACCWVQTADTIMCNEDCSLGNKGETIRRTYAYLLVRKSDQSPWQICDYGYPSYYVPNDDTETSS